MAKDIARVGPRTKIAGRDMKVGDLAVIEVDPGVTERIGRITGAYTIGGVWHVLLERPTFVAKPTWLPQSVKLRAIKTVYRKIR